MVPEPDYQWTRGNSELISHTRRIDAGAFGEVHEMVDTTSNQLFARKLIRPFGEVTLKDILDEAQAIEKLQKDIKCQNLVIVLRHGWLSSSPFYYIDMELCEANLEHYLRGKTSGYDTCNNPRFLGAIFETRGICHTWDIMHQISLGIDFIHSCKQVHRDLKPRNVLYCRNSMNWKIADFGLTSEATSRAHTTRYARGTPCYRAPELLREGLYTNKVDIFAMGCILFELVGGRKPFRGDFDVETYSTTPSPELEPQLSKELDGTSERRLRSNIFHMLDKNPSKRPTAGILSQWFRFQLSLAVGNQFQNSSQYERAIEAYENAASESKAQLSGSPSEVEPDSQAMVLKRLGDCYRALPNLGKAEFCYLLAVNRSPSPSPIHACLGGLYFANGRYGNSIFHYERAMSLDPQAAVSTELANAYAAAGTAALTKSDYDRAIDLYHNAIAVNPSSAEAWRYCGNAYLWKKDYLGAIQTFKDARKKFPRHDVIHDGLGKAYLAAGNAEAAVKVYEAAKLDGLISECIFDGGHNARVSRDMTKSGSNKLGSWVSRLGMTRKDKDETVVTRRASQAGSPISPGPLGPHGFGSPAKPFISYPQSETKTIALMRSSEPGPSFALPGRPGQSPPAASGARTVYRRSDSEFLPMRPAPSLPRPSSVPSRPARRSYREFNSDNDRPFQLHP